MTDHHDTEDDTTVPSSTPPEATRLDISRTDFDAPTAPYKRVPARTVVPPAFTADQPYVSPPGTHTAGLRTERERWQAAGRPPAWPDPPKTTEAVEVLNRILDERGTSPAAVVSGRRTKRLQAAPTLREVAEQRELEKARHERRLERLDVARAVVTLLILLGLFVLVVGAGVVGFGILNGWFEWVPRRTQ